MPGRRQSEGQGADISSLCPRHTLTSGQHKSVPCLDAVVFHKSSSSVVDTIVAELPSSHRRRFCAGAAAAAAAPSLDGTVKLRQ